MGTRSVSSSNSIEPTPPYGVSLVSALSKLLATLVLHQPIPSFNVGLAPVPVELLTGLAPLFQLMCH